MLNIGLESLKGDHPSKFAQELIDVFQAIIDDRDKETKVSKRIKAVERHAGIVREKIPKIVEKYTGIPCNKVILANYPQGMVACLPLIGLASESVNEAAWNAWDIYDAVGSGWETPFSNQEMLDLKNIATEFMKNGKVDNKKHKFKISYRFYYDLYFTLLARETISVKAREHTASDCAADVLHEIGHVVMLAEKASTTFIKHAIIRNRVLGWTKDKTISIKDRMEVTSKLVKDAIKNSNISKDSALAKLSEIDYETTPLANALINIFGFIGAVVCSIGILQEFIIGTAFTIIALFGGPIFKVINNILPIKTEGGDIVSLLMDIDKKMSDLPITKFNTVYTEWYADNYGLKNGLGVSSIRSLENLAYNGTLLNTPTPITANILTSAMMYVTQVSIMVSYLPFMGSEEHGTNTSRYEAMCRKLIAMMKKANIPSELKVDYLNQFDAMQLEMAKITSVTKVNEIMRAAYETASGLLKLGTVPFTVDVEKMVETLRANFENLINNRVYASLIRINDMVKSIYKK